LNDEGRARGLSGVGSLIVLAAGMGRRFGGAKQVESVGPNGELLLEYSLYDAVRVGFESVVFVIQKDQERDFRARLPDALFRRCQVSFAPQRLDDVPSSIVVPRARTKPWGTGHAVLSARRHVDGPFAVINADDFYGQSAFEKVARFLAEPQSAMEQYALVGRRLEDMLSRHGHVSRGICRVDADGIVEEIVEIGAIRCADGVITGDVGGRTEILHPDTIASMSMWGLFPSVLEFLDREFSAFLRLQAEAEKDDEFPISCIAESGGGHHSVKLIVSRGHWFGLTNRRDLIDTRAKIREQIEAGAYPAHLWEG